MTISCLEEGDWVYVRWRGPVVKYIGRVTEVTRKGTRIAVAWLQENEQVGGTTWVGYLKKVPPLILLALQA